MYFEEKWTEHYINKLESFVDTINSRVDSVTKIEPNKVSKKQVPKLRELAAEKAEIRLENATFCSW